MSTQKNVLPHLIKEWDYEKNNADNVFIEVLSKYPKSQRKVWWTCEKGHSYQSNIRHRNEGSLCPFCTNKKLLIGFNDFATVHPDLVSLWKKHEGNPDPSTVLFSTQKIEVQWPCPNGHFFPANPTHIHRGRGCVYCNGSKILVGYNDLASKSPDSLLWWDYDKNDNTPAEVRYGSKKIVWWKCPKGHKYDVSIDKFSAGRRCPFCAGKRNDDSTNLPSSHSYLIREWDFTKNTQDPYKISAGHDKQVWWTCETCSHEWKNYVYNRTNKKRPQGCPQCAKGRTSSLGEKQIFDFLNEHRASNILQHHSIYSADNKRFELDLYIPAMNIAIEFNGVYYHSEKFVGTNYHYDKWKECKNQGIQLIQVWEDDWYRRQDVIKKMLLHKIGLSNQQRIYARKTIIQAITYDIASAFLDNNHIQGSVSASDYLGLFHKEELVAVIALKKELDNSVINITRYATSENVVGGFTKLLSYIEKNNTFDMFTTFSDNSISDGGLYENNGFIVDKMIPPDYTYLVKGSYREHKFKYRKIKFKKDPLLNYQDNLTEKELAQLNNLLRIYDSGKVKWIRLNSRSSENIESSVI